MSLTNLTAADLRKIMSLVERKENLLARVATIDAELATYEGAHPVQATKPRAGRKTGPHARPMTKRVQRGSVKAAIISLIQEAGKSGITVKEIAAKLGVDYNRVFTWFYSTGKKIKDIKKVGPGKYEWVGAAKSVGQSEAAKPAAAVKAIKRAKLTRAKGNPRG